MFLINKKKLSCIITSNVLSKEFSNNKIKILTFFYASLIIFFTSSSFSLLLFSEKFQNEHKNIFFTIEIFSFFFLLLDFILWWFTSNIRSKKGKYSYLFFPFSLIGIMMILSITPSLYLINVWSGNYISIFKTFENMKFLRIFRIILISNLFPGLVILKNVFIKEKQTIFFMLSLTVITIFVFSLVIYNLESDNSIEAISTAKEILFKKGITNPTQNDIYKIIKIHSFLDSVYFSTISLTTIGFGDIYPITIMGKSVLMFMSILGIAILSIPTGFIAGSFIKEIRRNKEQKISSKNKKKK